jgi:prophage regulatory protein
MLPEYGYLRARQILGDRKRGISPLIPVSRSTWFRGIREKRYPAGLLLSTRVRVWSVSEIRELIENPEVVTIKAVI